MVNIEAIASQVTVDVEVLLGFRLSLRLFLFDGLGWLDLLLRLGSFLLLRLLFFFHLGRSVDARLWHVNLVGLHGLCNLRRIERLRLLGDGLNSFLCLLVGHLRLGSRTLLSGILAASFDGLAVLIKCLGQLIRR